MLFLYLENDKSETTVELAVKRKFRDDQFAFIPPLKNRIRKLVAKTLQKFRTLTDATAFIRFKDICNEPFPVSVRVESTAQEVEVNPESPSTSRPLTVDPNPSTSQNGGCPKCPEQRKRLKKAIQKRKKMHEQDMAVNKYLRSELQKKKSTRVLNQKIRRKEATIQMILEKKSEMGTTLKNKHRLENKRLRRKQKRELARAVQKADNVQQESLATIETLQNKVKEKGQQICALENSNMELEENLNDTESASVFPTTSEGRMSSVNKRMFVYDCVINQVATGNIPKLIDSLIKRFGAEVSRLPQRNTVEMMVRELGVIS